VDQAAAERAIGGFVCVNDVTCRDLQKIDGQWGRAKGFDTFCPVGPKVVAGLDWRSLELICRVNGIQRQRARSTDMHFSIPELISFLSGIMTLEPGDLIATGTPAGTAPLQHGDTVEVEIPGVGILSNPVRNADN
jgi:2-keto-4-pentenoate hydratase/2-oxohepta-3-ene-1,7-dioic acid hydratase in catechol pathway